MDTTIHRANFKLVVRMMLSKVIKILLGKDVDNDSSFKMLMKNDTRKDALIRYMNTNK